MPDVKEQAADYVHQYLRALLQRVDPAHFAEFLRNATGANNGVSGDPSNDNLPGYAYLSRVSEAGYNALTAHGKAANNAWEDIRRGRYGFGNFMATIARLTENYYGVLCEATRGLEAQRRPAWLLVQYSRANPTDPHTIRLETVLTSNVLEFSKFEVFGGGDSYDDLYAEDGKPTADGARISLRFDRQKLIERDPQDGTYEVANGHYVSFIFPKGVGSSPPVAIVVLHVQD